MTLKLKPSHKEIREYYAAVRDLQANKQAHEGAVAPHFAKLLRACLSQYGNLELVEQYQIQIEVKGEEKSLRADGALVDKQSKTLLYGIWEAKDSKDNLEKEVQKKFKAGYPADNILFQSPKHVILYQQGDEVLNESIENAPDKLIYCLERFLEYRPPVYKQWEKASLAFKDKVKSLGDALVEIVRKELKENKSFREAFENFSKSCRSVINPNLADDAIVEMLVQHLLTERLFRTVFKNPDFVSRNVIANEIEKVITALTSRSFSRTEFLKSLDHFYFAIEETAATIHKYEAKQNFLNVIYENFFQGFAVKVADTHGIVYTPQPIVNFMVNSVQEILKQEFKLTLASHGVHVLDPFTGTGNFILRIMREINAFDLEHKYANELHCNEIMLLPYYIASMNIEHMYYERVKQYQSFKGICLVDTFELAEPKQGDFNFFVPENTERVNAQKAAPIFVIIGNPPYNVGQQNENDNNRNRKYPHLDGIIADTYAKESKATLKSSLSDAYIKAFAWATERLEKQDNGVIAFVTNNGFLDGIATDGMRKHLGESFSKIYHVDLKGNARTSGERRRQEGGNVFNDQIRVGVGITFLVKCAQAEKKPADIFIYKIDDYLKAEEKQTLLSILHDISKVAFKQAQVDKRYMWHTGDIASDFETFTSIGSKDGKATKNQAEDVIFKVYSRGIATNGDAYIYNHNCEYLSDIAQGMVENFKSETDRWKRSGQKEDLDSLEAFLKVDEHVLKWIRHTKRCLLRRQEASFNAEKIRRSLYRPYCVQYCYFDKMFSEDFYQFPKIFPIPVTEEENRVICLSGVGSNKPFHCLTVKLIPCLDSLEKTQCFPFYTYDETGSHRQENITEWALKDYQSHYADEKISKWDIFYYVYGLLHHQGYRDKYAANLKRELPRIPQLKDFWKISHAGKKLAELHVNYEAQPEYSLDVVVHEEPLNWQVEKMRFNKEKTAIKYNDSLTLSGIPSEALEYKLGNRSALDWVIEQYQVSTDKRSGITNDPNNREDERYIIRLIRKIVTVSVETVKLMKELNECEL